MPEVETFFKEGQGDCGCGCGAYGTLKKAWRDGTRCVARKCKCPRCRGKKNRRSGLRQQSKARKALGVAPSSKFGDANEERWNDPMFATEVKSGAQCGPVVNAWRKAKGQIDAYHPDHGGQHRSARVVWMHPDAELVTVELETWRVLVGPALAHFYGET